MTPPAVPGRLTARAVADLVGGRLEGDGSLPLHQLAPLDRAGPDALSFLLTSRYLGAFRRSRAGAVLLAATFAGEAEGPATRIVVDDLPAALTRVAGAFAPGPSVADGVHPNAVVAPDARLGVGTSVGPGAVLESGVVLGVGCTIGAGAFLGAGVVVGDQAEIGPNAVCYAGTRLGHRVVLKAGAVVGGPGFGYLRGPAGHQRIPHLGGCILEDEVEIGSGSCVDRGNFEDTVIGRGTKLDNLVQVGHNVRIGARCLIMATTGIAGSCRIGDDVVIAGGVGVADHVVIGDGAVIGAKSVVFGPGRVAPGAVVSGYPARPHRAFLRAQAALYQLAPLADRLAALAEARGGASAPDHPAAG
ncbi:MAG: UDP-3-O-(3-hydroxymyristoyl)glucosamine N-acyltransferase [Gemmatimonadetes bacterium]|nr:UDP-3-O-(3-hydroxymyristoyl)glucosamine N-acyltransferase [Gemmatimonadota bacterium]MBK7348733.1 UDP-3-O-(3-hydroxymyristoyl)glucosamine N-acyltransferase [Gemmatimonadota bacterium]MBK7783361.1 UDP-3-O-(3-hydroxymyristoyl)glucosamine N-acyltransferase [Gemmatimonadota bacterium]MBK9068589.1 UDP-3-O-(3-hydroxymyristoyl)glucosamine N-acyltransferase [Gemmatimonadota bacterium]